MIEFRDGPVVLRALERQDCRALFEAEEGDDGPPTQYSRPGLAPESADQWFTSMQDKQGQSGVDFGVFDLDGRVMGHVQLHGLDWLSRCASVGIGFARRADRGKGHGKAALRLIVGYGFDHLGLHRLDARTVAFNRAAGRLFETGGFRQEGLQREAFFYGGRWHDRVWYSILENEFRALRNSAEQD